MSGRLGFVILCHAALDRAAQIVRHLAAQGCPVVVHVDARTPAGEAALMTHALADLPQVLFSPRRACEWGTWSLVAATQDAASLLLARFPDVRHVYLASGSCLPIRPVAELAAYLARHPRTDFIESVTIADVEWTVGGIAEERFTLRFPFSWRRQRRRFDAWVRIQRILGLRRRVPPGLVPHLGSQWWCLTRATLSAILDDPARPARDRFFRRVWIPDESYFQSLARLYSSRIVSRSLTLSKFDFQGKPHIFFDDHLQLLRRSDCFFARKIWPQAERLYSAFLSQTVSRQPEAEPNPSKIDRLFSRAVERRTRGRPGLYMQSRFPNDGWENGKTAAPFSVFEGFDHLFVDFEDWLARITGSRVHGHLFAPARAEFAEGEAVFNGCLSDSAALRDHDPRGFLTSLIWNTRGERQCFQFGPHDRQEIAGFVASDVNASVSLISGAWAIPLFHANRNFGEVRAEAARLQKVESDHIALLRRSWVKARVRIWPLAEFVENPMEPLQTIADEISPRALRRLTEAPHMADLQGFGQFLQNLRNQGMHPVLMGDFPPGPGTGDTDPPRRERPYLVK